MNTPHIVTLSGPSLSGKTELSKILNQEQGFNLIVSVTTRPQRSQEKNGVDYHFLTEDEYNKLELIQKTHYNNYHYGVSEKEVLEKSDKPILWVIAPQSIPQIEEYCKLHNYNLTKVFVNNPDEILYERLFKRFKEDDKASIETYVKRLVAMTDVEKKWITDATYDLIIDQFDEFNKQEVIDLVIKEVKEKSFLNGLEKNRNGFSAEVVQARSSSHIKKNKP